MWWPLLATCSPMSWRSAANSSSSRSAASRPWSSAVASKRSSDELRHLTGVRLRPVAPAGEAQHRAAPDGVGVVGPVGGIVVTARVEHDALAQRPFADRQLVEAEDVHRGGEHHRPGHDEIDPPRVEAVDPQPVGGGRRHQVGVHGEELAAVDGELVQRGRRVLVAPSRDHLGQRFERATAPDRELRLVRRDLVHDGREHGLDVVAQRAAVAFGDRIGADELGAEARDAEGDARRPHQAAGVADHHLEAAAAEIEAQRGRRVEHHRRADRAEDQARLLEPADDLDVHAGLGPDAVDDLAAVGGTPDGGRRLGQDLGGAGGLGEETEAAHGGHGLVGGGHRDRSATAHDVAEAQHLLLLHERIDVAVGVHVGHEQVEGVRPQVHGGDAHRLPR